MGDEVGAGTVAVIIVIWVIALAEPTPIGEATAIPVTLGLLGLDGEDS